MSHEVETMAYANEVPWHGLGNRVDDCVSTDEMLAAAGLDWEVQKVPTYIRVGDQEIQTNRYALVRSTDHKVMSFPSEKWNEVQPREVLEFFRHFTEKGGAKLETAGSLKGGELIWGLAKIDADFSLKGRDGVKGYILLTSSNKVGIATKLLTTAVRVVCANTMAMANRGGKVEYKQDHLKPFDIDAAREQVQLAKEGIEQLHMDAKALQSLQLSEFDNVRLLAKFFQPTEQPLTDNMVKELIEDPAKRTKKLDQVLWALDKAPGAIPNNAWGTMNAVTYWIDHMAGYKQEARLANSWLGGNRELRDKVSQELLEMAA